MLNQLFRRSSSVRGLVPVVAVGALVLVGCSAGQHAQTVGQIPAIDGVGADSGNLAVRNAAVLPPTNGGSYAKGADATLQAVLINSGGSTDQLVSVTSTAATAVVVSNAGLPDTATSASSGGTAASASASPAGSSPIDIGAGESVQVGYSVVGPNVELTGLTAQLFPSQTVPVTFTFKSGATISTNISVRLAEGDTAGPTIGDATEPAEVNN